MAKASKITITMPYGKPMHVLACDRFAIRREGHFFELDFQNEKTLKSLTVRVDAEEIEKLRDRFLDYLSKAQTKVPESQAPPVRHFATDTVVFADVIGLSFHGMSAEFAFHAISWSMALSGEAADSKLAAFYVASIRSSLELQIHWIAALYSL